jgi:hypothetical protein
VTTLFQSSYGYGEGEYSKWYATKKKCTTKILFYSQFE